jgi:protein arginine kinase activator
MTCQVCHNQTASKTIYITAQNKIQELMVCDDCAEIHDLSNPFAGLPDTMTVTLMGLIAKSLQLRDSGDEERQCPTCHTTLKEFHDTGTFGCPACYETFRDVILPLLRDIHGTDKHIGSRPVKFRKRVIEQNLDELETQLQKAVKSENYEKAAELRDLIHDLKNSYLSDND